MDLFFIIVVCCLCAADCRWEDGSIVVVTYVYCFDVILHIGKFYALTNQCFPLVYYSCGCMHLIITQIIHLFFIIFKEESLDIDFYKSM